VAGQSLQLETVEGESLRGNSVSLTQILRATKLKLVSLFWVDFLMLIEALSILAVFFLCVP